MSENSSAAMSVKAMISRFAIMLGAAGLVGFGGVNWGGLTSNQAVACAVFIAIIFGTLFFWGFRLAIAFLGLAVLIFTQSLTVPTFVTSASLEVIMFLVGMMIIVGALRDLGFFTWIVQLIVSMPNLNGKKFIFVTATASALLACAVDEVTSIIFISTLIFQVSDRLKLNATPYILIAVLATNIGSAGTMMGNPVGIYIGTKGELSFGDFMMWSFPVMLVSLLTVIAVLIWYFRKDLALFDIRLQERLERGLSIAPKVEVPYLNGLILIVITVVAIASHHQLEDGLGLMPNSVLLVMPLICAGIVMILKPDRARHYVEKEVDWWTLVFFMLLFAVAGTLEHTHVDKVMADGFSKICGTETNVLVPFIFTVSAFGSAFVDNVIFVAAFSPVIEQLSVTVKDLPLWWALLFGACFGGNITMIGSTANIVALGMLEKHGGSKITFFQWFKIGLLCTVISGVISVGALLAFQKYMPDHKITVDKMVKTPGEYHGQNAKFTGTLLAADGNVFIAVKGKAQKIYRIKTVLPDKGKEFIGKVVTVSGVLQEDKNNPDCRYHLTLKEIVPVESEK
ncbi:MAG: anion permease [Lentisphaeria bacterium]|nr:anion permease [Lentisphaeria bacterium]